MKIKYSCGVMCWRGRGRYPQKYSNEPHLYAPRNKVLEVFGFGIVAASLPFSRRAAGDPQQVGQACLRQANARAQLEHDLPKGIVTLMLIVPRHGCAPCLPPDQAAPNQECEATGKQHATCWRLTSPGTPAILRGVGCARGGSTLIEGCLGHGERLQTLPVTSSLVA
jgi:hypothetical protein